MTKAVGSPNWTIRRRTIFAVLAYQALTLAAAVVMGDAAMAEALAYPYATLAGIVVSAYVGGAAYEDVSKYRVNGAARTAHDPRENIYSE